MPTSVAAFHQYGPWKNQMLVVTNEWVVNTLSEKIATIDWSAVAHDAERFLNAAERQSLKLWSTRFFSNKAEQMRAPN